MPTIRNKTRQELSLDRIGRTIGADGDLEVTEEERAALAGHLLLDGVDRHPMEIAAEAAEQAAKRRSRKPVEPADKED